MQNQPSTTSSHATNARLALEAEIAQVAAEINASLDDLFAPFSQMVETQLRAILPLTRAAVVLTAGVGAPDSEELRAKRIYLGAALEMLHLALAVHMALGERAITGKSQNRSILGSTILAGDYCFSRSAGLAVRTGDPLVVEIFSEALKRVSEGNLRRFFEPSGHRFDENRELFLAGIAAAGQLTNAPAAVKIFGEQVVKALADDLARGAQPILGPESAALAAISTLPELSSQQQDRWHALFAWLAQT